MSDDINHDRCRFLESAAVTIAAAPLGMIDSTDAPFRDRDPVDAAAHPPRDGELRSFDRTTGWLNSRPLTAAVLSAHPASTPR